MSILSLLNIPEMVGELVTDVANKLIPDWNADDKHKHKIEELILNHSIKMKNDISKINDEQSKINLIEVNGNWFQRSWRPALGWVCTLSLFYAYLFQPVINWLLQVTFDNISLLPVIPTDNLYQLVLGMLGMSGLRTYEKIKKSV